MSEEQLILELHQMFKTWEYNGEDDEILTEYGFIFKNITDLQKEIARLNKIIDELEKYISQEWYCFDNESDEFKVAKDILCKLKELKEEGKE